MNNRTKIAFAIASSWLLLSCDRGEQGKDYSENLSNLEGRVKSLESDVFDLSVKSSPNVWLRLSDSGFSPLQTNIGTITIQALRIDSLGAGSKVVVQIGNPLAADITKLELAGDWGGVNKEGNPLHSSEHAFTATISERISSGSWTTTSFTLDGAKPSDVGFIKIESASAQSLNMAKSD